MATVTKRGNSYVVRYNYRDDQGKSHDGWESCKTEKEAKQRKQQIEYEIANNTFLTPNRMTVRELMEKWLDLQSTKHKWAPKTYEGTHSLIVNHILPFIGDLRVQDVRPYHLEKLYDTLSKTPCGLYSQGKKKILTEKQQQRLLSGTTIHEVHSVLRTAFLYAVEWRMILSSPVPLDAPKKTTEEREIWDEEQMFSALATMQDPMLHLAVHLTVVGSLRAGELLGLSPEDLDFEAAEGLGIIRINNNLQRVGKQALAMTDARQILRTFPDKREGSGSTLILKRPKNKSSMRKVYMTTPLKQELLAWLKHLEEEEAAAPEKYDSCGLLFRLPNGQVVEQTLICKKFQKWEAEHPEYGKIVFHALRHSSATYQLRISEGDIKAVQGNTGHARADMLVNTYARIQGASRRRLNQNFEQDFYREQLGDERAETVPTVALSGAELLEIIRNADPETKRELARALFV